jgi:hypothetical protein
MNKLKVHIDPHSFPGSLALSERWQTRKKDIALKIAWLVATA